MLKLYVSRSRCWNKSINFLYSISSDFFTHSIFRSFFYHSKKFFCENWTFILGDTMEKLNETQIERRFTYLALDLHYFHHFFLAISRILKSFFQIKRPTRPNWVKTHYPLLNTIGWRRCFNIDWWLKKAKSYAFGRKWGQNIFAHVVQARKSTSRSERSLWYVGCKKFSCIGWA